MIRKLNIQKKEFDFTWGDTKISFQTNFLAPQAEGSVVVEFGGLKFLGTTAFNKKADINKNFMPLVVDFREMFYSAGKIGGASYKRKEGRPSDEAVLISRLIDRSIRPMFLEGITNDIAVTITTLQIDKKNLYGVAGILAASLSIMLAGIPFIGPVGAVRIGYQDGKFIINPTKNQVAKMNLVVAGTKDSITMIEASGEDIPLEVLIQALKIAQKELKFICEKMEEFVDLVFKENNDNKRHNNLNYITVNKVSENLLENIYTIAEKYEEKFFPTTKSEFQRVYEELLSEINNWFMNLSDEEKIKLTQTENIEEANERFKYLLDIATFKATKKLLRRHLFKTGQRLDGRTPLEIRPLYSEVGLIERTHGSGLFQRGETQVLSIVTLGAPGKALLQDTLEKDDEEERFMHHYYMLPFATNEARSYRGQGRREIGHGYLAEKALRFVIPDETFPYTIRVVSEVLSSNGSTSMASVCASCLALMDAGVPIKKPVSGIAMGLVIENIDYLNSFDYKSNKYLKYTEINGQKYGYIILTDLQGQEDFTGDMDFKIAGSKDGITALQLDMKIKGLPFEVLKDAIMQGNQARLQILDFMLKTIEKPREKLSDYAPRLYTLKLTPDEVRNIIGKGGETIRKIIEEANVSIDFKDDGTTIITADNEANANKAISMIDKIIWRPKIGMIVKGKIIRIEPFGVFVDLGYNKIGLCHISNLSKEYISDITKVYNIGDEIEVEIINIKNDGKIEVKKVEKLS